MGVIALKIKAAVTSCEGFDPNELEIIEVPSMEEAVQAARRVAKPGGYCHSFARLREF